MSDNIKTALRRRGQLRIGNWNAQHGFKDTKQGQMLAHAHRLGLHALVVPESGQVRRRRGARFPLAHDYVGYYNGNSDASKHDHVTLVLDAGLDRALRHSPRTVGNRLIVAELVGTGAARSATIIAAYAPQSGSDADVSATFQRELDEVIDEVPKHHLLLLVGDFNAKVGSAADSSAAATHGGVIGRHGMPGPPNAPGLALIQIARKHGLCIADTLKQHNTVHKVSFSGNLGQPPHNPDLTLLRQQHKSLLIDARTFRLPNGVGTKMVADHELKVTSLEVPTWRAPRPTEKLDYSALANPEVAQRFRAMAEEVARAPDPAAKLAEIQGASAPTLPPRRAPPPPPAAAGAAPAAAAPAQDWYGLAAILPVVARRVLPPLESFRRGADLLPPEIKALLEQKRRLRDAQVAILKNGNPSDRTRAALDAVRGQLAQLRHETRPAQRRAKAAALDEAAVAVQAHVDQKRYGAAWRAVDDITGVSGPPKKRARVIKRPDGVELTDPRAQAEAFADAAKAHFNRDDHVAPEVLAGLNTEPNLEPSGLPSSPDDVLPFLKRAANGRAADANGITKELVVAAGPYFQSALAAAVLLALAGTPPAPALRSELHPIFKKDDPEQTGNYRFILMVDLVRKLAGIIVAAQLGFHAACVLREEQCGFRPGRGCGDQLFIMRCLEGEAIERQTTLALLFLDLETAFDRVDRPALWAALRHYRVNEDLIKVLAALYDGTSTCARWGGRRSRAVPVTWGTQQGGPEAPILFLFFINLIFAEAMAKMGAEEDWGLKIFWRADGQLIRPSKVAAALRDGPGALRLLGLLLADDVTLVCELQCIDALQRVLDEFHAACVRFGLPFNLKKCKLLLLNRRGAPAPTLRIGAHVVAVVERETYLGALFCETATVDAEVNARCGAAYSAGNSLASLFNSPNVKLATKVMYFIALVQNRLLYAAETLAVTAAHLQQMERCRMTFISMICRRLAARRRGRYDPDNRWARAGYAETLAICGLEPVGLLLRRRRLIFLGKIARSAPERHTRQVLFGQIDAKRRRGRPAETLRSLMFKDWLMLQPGAGTTSVGWGLLDKTADRTTWDNLVTTTAGDKLWPAAAV